MSEKQKYFTFHFQLVSILTKVIKKDLAKIKNQLLTNAVILTFNESIFSIFN